MITQMNGQRVFEALLIVGLGVIWGLDFWWPGLLIDFGAAYAIVLLLQKRYWKGTAVLVFFDVVPALYVSPPLLSESIPLVIVGLGAAGMYRALRM